MNTTEEKLTFVEHLEELRKFDLADRKQQILKARVNYLPRTDMDFGVTLQAKADDYPADFGRTGAQTRTG